MKDQHSISQSTMIDTLVEEVPGAVKYLADQGIRCIICGEPIWGSLGDAAREKGFSEEEILRFVTDLNELAGQD